ncbi:MAG: hypothetical protein AAFN74_27225, partial [Myxococcota bacterium]
MQGCLDGQVCNRGSCVVPGEDKPYCGSDLDCPSFQVCLQDGCYSNCEQSSDCAAGMTCYQKACRVPCRSAVNADNCPAETYCYTADGENGYCRPLAGREAPQVRPVDGQLTVDADLLTLSNTNPRASFQITTNSLIAQRVQIRKLGHTLITADGERERVEARRDPQTGELLPCDAVRGECPLAWVKLDAGNGSSLQSQMTIEVRPDCGDQCPSILVDSSGNHRGVRWTGQLEVVSSAGRAIVELSYIERPEGQWVGTMHYYAQFGDVGVSQWRNRTDKADTTEVKNGLLKKWGAFRRGSMDGWSEFLAILASTNSESWKFERVIEKCVGDESACYPFEGSPTGVRTYVNNEGDTPIPTGLSELPLVVNLRMPRETPHRLVGRVESRSTLHYPKNPRIEIELAADPSRADACDHRVFSDCVVPISHMAADILVGGRYTPNEGEACFDGFT